MNVTRSVDEHGVARAQQVAAGRGTTLDQLTRPFPEEITRPANAKPATDRLDALWSGRFQRIARRLDARRAA